MKIMSIVGARPQFIKAAVLSNTIRLNNKSGLSEIDDVVVHTGQHFDPKMSQIFFDQMKITKPRYNLGVNSLSHGAMTARILEQVEKLILDEKPNNLLVYGDTNSTLAGALAAAKLGVPIAHVEAGLRSHNWSMPEEINRVLTDRLSRWAFCPSKNASENLQRENICPDTGTLVSVVGDIMYEAVNLFSEYAVKPKCGVPKKFLLATVHRAENTDERQRLEGLGRSFRQISNAIPIVLPLHPRTKQKAKEFDVDFGNTIIIDPVGYFEMLWLLERCEAVLTDSGGLQKEAYFKGKYCITLRDETEWTELLEAEVNFLAGVSLEKIVHNFEKIMDLKSVNFVKDIYGNGGTSAKILNTLLSNVRE